MNDLINKIQKALNSNYSIILSAYSNKLINSSEKTKWYSKEYQTHKYDKWNNGLIINAKDIQKRK